MVQPLHLQDNLSKIPLLQKIHETTRAVPEAEREQFAQQLTKELKTKSEKTQESKETEKNRIDEREKREKEKRKKQQMKAGEKGENAADEDEGISSGRIIDIVI